MAHVDFSGSVRVGKYGIDVPAFERIALPALRDALSDKRLVVIDEIGKMEIASPRFCDLVLEMFDSPLIVVATVMQKSHPFADRLKRRPDRGDDEREFPQLPLQRIYTTAHSSIFALM